MVIITILLARTFDGQFERLQLVYCENCTVWRVQLKLARQGLVLGGEDLLKF